MTYIEALQQTAMIILVVGLFSACGLPATTGYGPKWAIALHVLLSGGSVLAAIIMFIVAIWARVE